jgi:hypothetical protein
MDKNKNINMDKKPPSIEVEYEIMVTDKNGKIIEHRKEKSQSLVKNFLMLTNAAFKVSTSTVKDTGGTSRAAGAKNSYTWSNGAPDYTVGYTGAGGWAPNAPEADATYGIIVGTSDIAVTVDDYNLKAKIAHGNAAGQLYHYGTIMLDPTVAGLTVTQKFMRTFLNNSGAEITVKEIGLVVRIPTDIFLVLIIRDVITPVPVPNGGSLTINYYIKTG